jgi:hypothetical protein
MLIIVLAKETLSEHISEVSTTYTGVGLLGMMVGTFGIRSSSDAAALDINMLVRATKGA